MTKYKITTEVDIELKTGIVTGVEEIISPPPPPPPPIVYTCPIDGLTFATQELLDAHTLSAHPVTPPGEIYKVSYYLVGLVTVTRSPNKPLYASGERVTLTAKPYPGYVFVGWSGDYISTEPTIVLTMNSNKVLTCKTVKATIPPPVPPPEPTPEPPPQPPPSDLGDMKAVKVIDAQTVFATRMVYHGWVRHDAESPDGTMWTIQSTKTPAYHLFSALSPYAKIKDFPSIFTNSWDPDFRWSHNDSTFLYASHGAKFSKYEIATGLITELHDFILDFPDLVKLDGTTSIARVYGKEGGNPSWDDRYWAWCVRCVDGAKDWTPYIIVYDRETDTIVAKLANPPYRPLFVGMSPSGNYALVDGQTYGYDGVSVYPRDLSSVRLISCNIPIGTVHAFPGVGYDDEGNEVIVWVEQNPADSLFWVCMANIATGEKVWVTKHGDGSAQPFNASALYKGWAVISNNVNGEIYVIRLSKTNPVKWTVCKTSNVRKDHADDMFAKMNKKGTKIFFRANDGVPYADGGIINAYKIDLPTDWEKILLDQTPTVGDYVVDDFTFYPVPVVERPAKGVNYIDPIFHTSLVRITDAPLETGKSTIYPSYPKHQQENADGTRVMVQSFLYPGYHIYNTLPPYEMVCTLPATFTDSTNPDIRWDATNPDVLYSCYRRTFLKYNYAIKELTTLYDFHAEFPDAALITTMEEGNCSADSRYWMWWIRNSIPTWANVGFIVYDKDANGKDQGAIIKKLLRGEPLFYGGTHTSVSPSGKYFWIAEGNYIYPFDFSWVRPVTISGLVTQSHGDVCYDVNGREVFVGSYTYGSLGVWAYMHDLETGETSWLAPLGGGGGSYHVSGSALDKPGWILFSIYGPTDPNPETDWAHHSLFMVQLKKVTGTPSMSNHAKIWRVAHTHTKYLQYGDNPFASINRAGTRVYFGSGWGTSTKDTTPHQGDVYQINLPENWYEELK